MCSVHARSVEGVIGHLPDWRDGGHVLPVANEYGGLKPDHVKRLKELEMENARLRQPSRISLWRS